MTRSILLLIPLVLAFGTDSSPEQEVWSGYAYYFEKDDYEDWTYQSNQDRLTETVWLTRADAQGIFNIAQENSYMPDLSPADTEWATGEATEWSSLSFQPWQVWHDSDPLGAVGVDAVVHLIADDIYIDVRFESWTQSANGGGFSYFRGLEGTTSQLTSWSVIKGLYRDW